MDMLGKTQGDGESKTRRHERISSEGGVGNGSIRGRPGILMGRHTDAPLKRGLVMRTRTSAATLCRSSSWFSAAVCCALMACGGHLDDPSPSPGTPGQVATVTIAPGALTVSGSAYVSAVLRDAAGFVLPGRTVTWTVTDTLIATVTNDGVVYARTPGRTTILATSDGVSGSAPLTVPAPPPVASVVISPSTLSLEVGQVWQLSYALLDSAGRYKYTAGPTVWSTSDATRVTVGMGGLVRGAAMGIATITATNSGVTGSMTVRVIPTLPVGAVLLSPDTMTVTTGSNRQFFVTVLDSLGNRVLTRPVSWTTTDSTIAQVASYTQTDVQILARTAGTVSVIASSGSKQGTATLHVVAPAAVAQFTISPVTATLPVGRSMIVTTTALDAADHVIYPPTTWTISDTTKVVQRYYNGVIAVAPGVATLTASAGGKIAQLTITVTTPVPLPLSAVAGGQTACGIATSGTAYCWGRGMFGVLGNGVPSDTLSHPVPVMVSGAQAFSAITVGDNHACALASGTAYCWGLNTRGQLGVGAAAPACLMYGTPYQCSAVPLAVAATFSARQISAGATGTCAITSANSAYCWGDNSSGQLGIGGASSSTSPVAVTGVTALSFISLGRAHACAVAPGGSAWCWGSNTFGQIGASTRETCADVYGRIAGCSSVPLAVVRGGLTFSSIASGGDHTCALTSAGAAYCWGANASGELGNGSQANTDVPTAVAGGMRFTSLTAGDRFTCGIASGGNAWCWGVNIDSPYAVNPADRYSATPTLVAGGISFESISAGGMNVCGVATTHLAYCWGIAGLGQLGIGYEGPNTPPHIPVTSP